MGLRPGDDILREGESEGEGKREVQLCKPEITLKCGRFCLIPCVTKAEDGVFLVRFRVGFQTQHGEGGEKRKRSFLSDLPNSFFPARLARSLLGPPEFLHYPNSGKNTGPRLHRERITNQQKAPLSSV